jgi:hypothetical protein
MPYIVTVQSKKTDAQLIFGPFEFEEDAEDFIEKTYGGPFDKGQRCLWINDPNAFDANSSDYIVSGW